MKTITFNILKPLTLTALFFVFAASLNTASAREACGHSNECGHWQYCAKDRWSHSGWCTAK